MTTAFATHTHLYASGLIDASCVASTLANQLLNEIEAWLQHTLVHENVAPHGTGTPTTSTTPARLCLIDGVWQFRFTLRFKVRRHRWTPRQVILDSRFAV